MQLHSLTAKTSRTRARRIGRGGKRGKTSGRGGKGQTARAGAKLRPEWRDIIKRLPKRRGYGKHRAQSVVPNRKQPVAVPLAAIEAKFDKGETISPATLAAKGMFRVRKGGLPEVKILGNAVSKKFTFEKVSVSEASRKAIIEAGGTVIA